MDPLNVNQMESIYKFMRSPVRYWIVVLLPSIILGILANYISAKYTQEIAQQFFIEYMEYYILIYIPLIGIIRLRSLNLNLKEILLSLIPIYGIYYRRKRMFYSNEKQKD